MLRASVLSLLILSMVAVTLPSVEIFDGSGLTVEAARRHSRSWRARQARRARLRRLQRRRALARHRRNSTRRVVASRARWRRQQRLVARNGRPVERGAQNAQANNRLTQHPAMPFGGRQNMLSVTLPQRWAGASAAATHGETRWSVRAPDGRQAGVASLRPVGSAGTDAPVSNYGRSQSVGGVSVTHLRRGVIERMVAEGGWVTNDFVRQIGGRRVFVVTAQTGNPSAPAHAWAFYFTEVDGGVYSLTTSGLSEYAEVLANESAQMLASLRSNTSTTAALATNRSE